MTTYIINIDKNPSSNPSAERRQYTIQTEELRRKIDICDSIVITRTEDYIMRRLAYNPTYQSLTVLDPPVKEPLTDINIELFEGDNYIYLTNLSGNVIYAEYLIDNEFNELYVTETEMSTALRQTSTSIGLYIDGQIERVDGDIEDLDAALELKVDKNDNDQIVTMLNASADEINLAGGSSINLSTAGKLIISAGNFQLDNQGNMTCSNANVSGTITSSNATITGGSMIITDNEGGTISISSDGISLNHNNTWIDMTEVYNSDAGGYYPSINIGIGDQGHIMLDALDGIWTSRPIETDNYLFAGSYITTMTNLYVDDGSIRSENTYSNTSEHVTNAPNVYITSNGWFRRTTGSSERWKKDITEKIEERLNPKKLYDLPVKQYKYKDDCISKDDVRKGKNILGFIAEDVAKIYEPAVQYDENGKVEMWNAQIIIPAMLKLIQEQKKEIDNLKERVSKLEEVNNGQN